ncbi:MFS transporter [Nocardioides scoriae]|nr:MFS transporter [Nocardioides scoriae]
MQHTPPSATSSSSSVSTSLSPEGFDPQSIERFKVTGRLRRLLVWYGLASFGAYVCIGAVNAVLLPLQIEQLDPANKAANLAFAAALGAVAGMVAQPVAGLLSDRTRSKRGARAPWMVSGALGAAIALVVLGGMSSLVGLVIVYIFLNVALNLYLGPKTAIMPDRVPRGVRGLFSAVAGLGVLFGVLGGQVVGAVLSSAPFVGYSILAVMIVLAGVGLVRFNPDHDNREAPREPMHWSMLLRTFWVSPRQHPDFAFGFLGRLMTLMGFYLVNTFQLFLLQDYVGLGDEAVDVLPLLALTALGATLLSTVLGGPLSDRIGRRKPVAVVAGLLIGASLIAPWLMPTVTGFFIYALVAGLGFGAYLAVDQALLSEVLPSTEDNGRYLGVLNIAVALPSALAAAVAGTVVSTLGYSAIFPLGIVISVIGALAILPIKSVR